MLVVLEVEEVVDVELVWEDALHNVVPWEGTGIAPPTLIWSLASEPS